MNLPAIVKDNITEALVKIIEFTQTRQKVLAENINGVHQPGFVPKDLDVPEFSSLMNAAVCEHARTQRLLLRDSENIKFGPSGNFAATPIVDEFAAGVLARSRDEFLALQIEKLMENSLNQKVAIELLRQKKSEHPEDQLSLN